MHASEISQPTPVHDYKHILPDDLKRELEEHLKGNPKDLTSEVAIARTVLSMILGQMQTARMVNPSLERVAYAANHGTVAPNGDRTFQVTMADSEYQALLNLIEEGRTFVSIEALEVIGKMIGRVTSTVESQAKVNPEWVMTRVDVAKILDELVLVIDRDIPREMMEVRTKLMSDIQRYCLDQLKSRGMEMALGAQPIRGAKG
jgi:hypothetical protein